MLTFEEFFTKKRIDLDRLKQARPELFDEFSTHYLQMGEKSFDHTKKYWFNRLRKDFPLSEDEVARLTKPAKPTPAGTPPMPSQSASKPAGFTPRFKAQPVVPKPDTPGTEKPVAKAPTGFKPRFKAGTTPATQSTDEPNTRPSEATPPATDPPTVDTPAKPLGFKPRFKAGVTPVAKPNEQTPKPSSEAASTGADDTPKPLGFKPRFKPSTTPPPKPNPDDEKNTDA